MMWHLARVSEVLRVAGGGIALLGTALMSDANEVTQRPLHPRQGGENSVRFESIPPAQTGVGFQLRFPDSASFDLLTDHTSGAGVAIGDVDSDGLPDLFFAGYNQGNRLYRNLGDWRFEDITSRAGVGGGGRWCGGATFVDIDGDEDLDLYVCAYDAPNLLYLNQGGGQFEEAAARFGLDFSGASVSMAFADYDRDGDLDGYLVTHRLKKDRRHLLPQGTQDAVKKGILQIDRAQRRASVSDQYQELFELMSKGGSRMELIIAGQRDHLFRNDGAKGFRDVSREVGIAGFGIGLAASWWDYDGDGWPDLYVSNDYKGADQLYRNLGDGRFQQVARKALPHVPWFSMGSDTADINNDGWMDLLASDMSGTDHFSQKMGMGEMGKNQWFLVLANPQQYMRNALFLGTGTGRVLESAYLCGLANTDWTWSPKFGDLDLDGRVDLFVSNGMSRDFMNSDLAAAIRSRDSLKWRQTPILKQANLAFRNEGDLQFSPVGKEWGLDQVAASYGAAYGDLDRDGDLDLVVSHFNEPVSLYRNQTLGGKALLVRLRGRTSNRWGIGTKVTVALPGQNLTRVLSTSQGFMSSNESMIHFGIPADQDRVSLSIEWPSGAKQQVADVSVDQWLTIQEPDDVPPPAGESAVEEPWFSPVAVGKGWSHRERPFDDYQSQPLLPAKQSQHGPGLAVGDVDGDGREDYFVGGAAGQGGALFLARNTGWVRLGRPFALDAQAEDMGAVFFDVDGDDDLDLYVVSGGVEAPQGSSLYLDRLYLNSGDGGFAKADSSRLPSRTWSGSCVNAADFDRDGDLDLFVGGRSRPGQYPLAADNLLLRNEGGRLVDVSAELAEGLQTSGIVTAALWTDFNADGWADLLVAHHWGPVRCYLNREGRLVDQTEARGLSDGTGWWNGIVAQDVDGDQDLDYFVSNLGHNSKYHGDAQHPCVIYYGDVDGSGLTRIVEAKFEGEVCYPERGKSCSSTAIPSLAGKFKSFERFAMASLTDIYPSTQLAKTLKLEVRRLDSGVLINEQDRGFRFVPLSRYAQLSPGFGGVAADFNGDGERDFCLVQNDHSLQPETGRMDGGMGCLLAGTSGGGRRPVWPRESGIRIAGAAKAVAVTDLDQNGAPDLLVTQNHGPVLGFAGRGAVEGRRFISITLSGRRGNRTAVGSRVSVQAGGSPPNVFEVSAGQGYLSQSSSRLFVGIPQAATTVSLKVTWPSGVPQHYRDLPIEGGIVSVEEEESRRE